MKTQTENQIDDQNGNSTKRVLVADAGLLKNNLLFICFVLFLYIHLLHRN